MKEGKRYSGDSIIATSFSEAQEKLNNSGRSHMTVDGVYIKKEDTTLHDDIVSGLIEVKSLLLKTYGLHNQNELVTSIDKGIKYIKQRK